MKELQVVKRRLTSMWIISVMDTTDYLNIKMM